MQSFGWSRVYLPVCVLPWQLVIKLIDELQSEGATKVCALFSSQALLACLCDAA